MSTTGLEVLSKEGEFDAKRVGTDVGVCVWGGVQGSCFIAHGEGRAEVQAGIQDDSLFFTV